MKKIIAVVCVLAFPQSLSIAHAEDLPPLCNGRECLEQMVDTYAQEYGVSAEKIGAVIQCESGWNPNAVNWQDSHATSEGSHGISQFAKPTIEMYGKKIGMVNPDPYNPEQAIEVMAYMFSIGEAKQWTCYTKIYGKI